MKRFINNMNKFSNNNFTTCEYVGGLGNQLFGIYTALAYSLRFNKVPIFKYLYNSPGITHRLTYWNSIFKNLKTYTNSNIYWDTIINENKDSLYSMKNYGNNNVIFKGYFQSYYNFQDQLENINNILEIENQKNIIKEKYKYLFETKNIAIHFRMGDYKYIETHPLLADEYYMNSLKNININHENLYVFCERQDRVLVETRMKNILRNIGKTNYPFKIIHGENDVEEMFLISLCDEIIIANSSFSWWGAVFSNTKNVYIPYRWLYEKTTNGLILPGWKTILF